MLSAFRVSHTRGQEHPAEVCRRPVSRYMICTSVVPGDLRSGTGSLLPHGSAPDVTDQRPTVTSLTSGDAMSTRRGDMPIVQCSPAELVLMCGHWTEDTAPWVSLFVSGVPTVVPRSMFMSQTWCGGGVRFVQGRLPSMYTGALCYSRVVRGRMIRRREFRGVWLPVAKCMTGA